MGRLLSYYRWKSGLVQAKKVSSLRCPPLPWLGTNPLLSLWSWSQPQGDQRHIWRPIQRWPGPSFGCLPSTSEEAFQCIHHLSARESEAVIGRGSCCQQWATSLVRPNLEALQFMHQAHSGLEDNAIIRLPLCGDSILDLTPSYLCTYLLWRFKSIPAPFP